MIDFKSCHIFYILQHPNAVSISRDFAAVRLIFLHKICLARYEIFAIINIFLNKLLTPGNFIPHWPHFKNILLRFVSRNAVLLLSSSKNRTRPREILIVLWRTSNWKKAWMEISMEFSQIGKGESIYNIAHRVSKQPVRLPIGPMW